MQIGTVSGLWLCGRSWRFGVLFWRNIMCFRKSYICSNKLDVQETNISFSQFNRICRSIMHYTSYLRTKDCTNNGYVTNMLEHNIDTGVHMISHNTQTWAPEYRSLDNSHCVTSWLKSSSARHWNIHAWSSVRCVCVGCPLHLVLSPFLLFSVAPLPDFPDALLRCPQQVHVSEPAQLPLGDRGQ